MAMDAVRLDFVGTSAQNFNILLVARKVFCYFHFIFNIIEIKMFVFK